MELMIDAVSYVSVCHTMVAGTLKAFPSARISRYVVPGWHARDMPKIVHASQNLKRPDSFLSRLL
jgi:hypothetical protein